MNKVAFAIKELQTKEYLSFDTCVGESFNELPSEMLQMAAASGVPPHKLILSPNCYCLVMRNLDPEERVMNGTKIRIVSLSNRVIHCENLLTNRMLVLPRIKF